ncbi:flavin reductase [Streptomyces sp. NPDC058442]|uniref:flavin reductase n=1 Tax=Streptomyces sp. NPDC058442 TaxID=3346503 RepID=UPI0036563ED7
MSTVAAHKAVSNAPDPRAFRNVMGHFPTGVVVVTGIASDGRPAGMVIGSFTSVSLEPPVVAYLPSKSSKSYVRLSEAEVFCVNVLSADQEHLCRQFAKSDDEKFEGLDWTPSPAGAPILPGAVAWIECRQRETLDVGDHYIVLGDTTALGVQNPDLPLLFFQGGYGSFSHGSLLMPGGPSFIRSVRLAETLRARIEDVAHDLGAQCDVLVRDGGEGVLVASANQAPGRVGSLLGARIPIVAPLQPLFVTGNCAVPEDAWFSLGRLDEELRRSAEAQLERVRERGWSLVLKGGTCEAEMDHAMQRFADSPRTPTGDREFVESMGRMSSVREPEKIDLDARYDVLYLAVPVVDVHGEVVLTLKLSQLPEQAEGREILRWVSRLQDAARECAEDAALCA